METVLIHGPDGSVACEVLVKPGALDLSNAGELLVPHRAGRAAVAFLAQPASSSIARSLARSVREAGLRADTRVLPDRDESKSLAVASDVYLWLNDLGFTRGDTVVGVGGGALTDLAGFVAATYLRGVECMYVPTTMLGAVDAAIGGKVGLNVGGKNLVGVFRHPARVLIDPAQLGELPSDVIVEGAAEALKAGLVGDPDLVKLLATGGLQTSLAEVVVRAIRVKAAIVEADFTEAGMRGVLNYGHTVGHAIETATGIPHGHAVAIGMVAAGAASAAEVGFDGEDFQRDAIAALGLPVTAPNVDRSAIVELMRLDKKRTDEGLRMTLLRAVGDAVVVPVDTATVDAALGAVDIG